MKEVYLVKYTGLFFLNDIFILLGMYLGLDKIGIVQNKKE